MKERPIIFSGEMVRAILVGNKTQTRRVIKPQPPAIWDSVKQAAGGGWCFYKEEDPDFHGYRDCPYGQIGDRLWAKEKHCLPKQGGSAIGQDGYDNNVLYAADEGLQRFPLSGNWTQHNRDFKWRPSIHMPRWASRIDLEIVGVRVEMVQDITEADAKDEGIHGDVFGEEICIAPAEGLHSTRIYFSELWDSINEKRGFGWNVNPWVWVIGFKIVGRG